VVTAVRRLVPTAALTAVGFIAAAAIVVIGLAGVIALWASDINQGLRIEVPQGYRGWIEIRFDDARCPPLHAADQFAPIPFMPWRRYDRYSITVPASGRVCTAWRSNGQTQLWIMYVTASGKRQRLFSEPNSGVGVQHIGYSGNGTVGYYFVGTRADFDMSPKPPFVVTPIPEPLATPDVE
jgi:hypothetical protein